MRKCSNCKKTEEELSKGSNASRNIINHHLDYYTDKTIPLCFSCHRKWHNKNKPLGTPKEGKMIKRARMGLVKGKEWKENSKWLIPALQKKEDD